MTTWQSIGLALALAALGCLVTYFYRPRAPKISWASQRLPILPGPIQGVKVHLDDTLVSEFILLSVAIRNNGASVGVDNTVRPLRIALSENFGICKFVYLSAPDHVTCTPVYDSASRSLEIAIDNLNRRNELKIFFLCSGEGPGIEVSGAFRGMNGEPKGMNIARPRRTGLKLASFYAILIAAALWLILDPSSRYARISAAAIVGVHILFAATTIMLYGWVMRYKMSGVPRVPSDLDVLNKMAKFMDDQAKLANIG